MAAEHIALWLVRLAGAYLAAGLVFALPFVWRGAGRIDPVAREGTWGFRILIIPGAVALWPLLLRRWLGGVTAPPAECSAHRAAARVSEQNVAASVSEQERPFRARRHGGGAP